MPSDAKKRRAAKKKETAKLKDGPAKKVEENTENNTNGIQNGSSENGGKRKILVKNIAKPLKFFIEHYFYSCSRECY